MLMSTTVGGMPVVEFALDFELEAVDDAIVQNLAMFNSAPKGGHYLPPQ